MTFYLSLFSWLRGREGGGGGGGSRGFWPPGFGPFPRPSITYALSWLLRQVLKIKEAWRNYDQTKFKVMSSSKGKISISCTFKGLLFYQYTETA